ncbi:MAG: M28 family peptidase [Acidobacteria bacterium]|nr:M28 family peptidase [Acidobacteriota bacterium]
MRRISLFLLLAAAGLAADASVEARRWWAHVQALADDKLEGRNTGSPEYRKAAEYVAGRFRAAGLEPAGVEGYFQPIPFRSRKIIEEKSKLELVFDGKAETVRLGDEAYFSLRAEPDPLIEAPAVFAGYALQISEARYDDLAGLDLHGKIAVYIDAAPAHLPSELAAHAQSVAERWGRLRAAGAIGVATLRPRNDIPWERSSLARFMPSMSLTDPKLVDTTGQRVAIAINPAKAGRFFSGTGHTAAELIALHRDKKPLPKFPLKALIRARPVFTTGEVVSDNVAAILRGTDPKLKNEFVVISAHLDHIGVGRPIKGDAIYNGAMDNASGVASLIEMARVLGEARPKRSILFLAVTGEEKGLLGSRYFANRPTVPATSIIADVNIDMFLPIVPLKMLTVYGLDESTLGEQIQAAAKEFGIAVQRDPEPHRRIFIRSDQYNFIRRGIPAMYFKVGAAPGSPEDQVMKAWLKNRYHAPSDDLQQPVDLKAAVKFNRVVARFTRLVADDPARPHWNKTSFFRRFAKTS